MHFAKRVYDLVAKLSVRYATVGGKMYTKSQNNFRPAAEAEFRASGVAPGVAPGVGNGVGDGGLQIGPSSVTVKK